MKESQPIVAKREIGVQNFTKRPVTVQAIQWNNLNRDEISSFVGEKIKLELESETAYLAGKGAPKFSILINTKEGVMKAMIGDWIIKEPFPTGDRDYYPVKAEIFEKTYIPSPDVSESELRKEAKKFWDGLYPSEKQTLRKKYFPNYKGGLGQRVVEIYKHEVLNSVDMECESCGKEFNMEDMIEGEDSQYFCKECWRELSQDDEFMGRETPKSETQKGFHFDEPIYITQPVNIPVQHVGTVLSKDDVEANRSSKYEYLDLDTPQPDLRKQAEKEAEKFADEVAEKFSYRLFPNNEVHHFNDRPEIEKAFLSGFDFATSHPSLPPKAEEAIKEAVKNFESLYHVFESESPHGNVSRQMLLTFCKSSINSLKDLIK